MTNNLLTPAELSKKLGMSLVTLWRMRKDGTGPKFIRIGKRSVRYLADDVPRWVIRNARGRADQ